MKQSWLALVILAVMLVITSGCGGTTKQAETEADISSAESVEEPGPKIWDIETRHNDERSWVFIDYSYGDDLEIDTTAVLPPEVFEPAWTGIGGEGHHGQIWDPILYPNNLVMVGGTAHDCEEDYSRVPGSQVSVVAVFDLCSEELLCQAEVSAHVYPYYDADISPERTWLMVDYTLTHFETGAKVALDRPKVEGEEKYDIWTTLWLDEDHVLIGGRTRHQGELIKDPSGDWYTSDYRPMLHLFNSDGELLDDFSAIYAGQMEVRGLEIQGSELMVAVWTGEVKDVEIEDREPGGSAFSRGWMEYHHSILGRSPWKIGHEIVSEIHHPA